MSEQPLSREQRLNRLRTAHPEIRVQVNGTVRTLDAAEYEAQIAEWCEAEEARELRDAVEAQQHAETVALLAALDSGTADMAKVQIALARLIRAQMPSPPPERTIPERKAHGPG